MELKQEGITLPNYNLEIKKKLQNQANFYLEIMEVLQRLEIQGKLNELINCLKAIHLEEQSFLIHEMQNLEDKASSAELNEIFSANSQIFKKNFLLIIEILVEEVWANNLALNNNSEKKNLEEQDLMNFKRSQVKKELNPQQIITTPVKKTKEVKIINKILKSNEEFKVQINSDQKAPAKIFYNLKKNYKAQKQNQKNDKSQIRSQTSLAEIHKIEKEDTKTNNIQQKECSSLHYVKSSNSLSLKVLEKIESEFSFLKISGKFGKEKRKIADSLTENSETRGPGLYNIEKADVFLSTNKTPHPVSFSKSPKNSQFDKSKEELSPGPGAYNPKIHYVTK